MRKQEICVSVICIAYNHEAYIRDALEGFVTQETDFAYEVFVHDDASTDATAAIIREYEARYPDIIHGIYQQENQYSKGAAIIEEFVMPLIHGEYIALCEGDDYWIDVHKLKKQVAVLVQHPELDICAHRSKILEADTLVGITPLVTREQVFSAEEVILGGGDFVPTASLFCRTAAMEKHYRFRTYLSMDYTWQIQGALRGGMYYMPDCMSVYRQNVSGSWTDRIYHDVTQHMAHLESDDRMLALLDADTNGCYHDAILYRRMRRAAKMLKLLMDGGRRNEAEWQARLVQTIRRHAPGLIRARRVSRVDKLKFFTLFLNRYLFYFVYRIGDWRNQTCRRNGNLYNI